MKVLLINPPLNTAQPYNGAYPMGLGYIGAALKIANCDVDIIDVRLNNYDNNYVSDFIRINSEKYSIYCISAMVTTMRYTKWISNEIKKFNKNCFVIVGGSISTASELLLSNSGVDIVCIGEGEKVTADLIKAIRENGDFSKIPGIVFKRDKKNIYTGSSETMDIDSIPFPAWELFDMEQYTKNTYIVPVKTPSITMITERGCPFSCSFCYRNFGKKVRHRNPKLIVEEIKSAIDKYGIGHIDFLDEIFNVSPLMVKELCNLIIKENLNITWRCIGRTDLVDKETLQLMYDSGCKWIGYGIESGSQDMLNKMDKKQEINKIERSIELSRKVGMIVTGTFIIGMPGENEKTIQESGNFFAKNRIFNIPFFPVPYPGTSLYEECIKHNKISNEEDYILSLEKDATELIINLSDLSSSRLLELKNNLIDQYSKYIPNMKLSC